MIDLTEEQLADLIQLQGICNDLRAELVIIGAIAYKFRFPNVERYTADIDLTVALDLDEFAELETRMAQADWSRENNREHRWKSALGTLVDLLPAGVRLRTAKKLVWPKRQFSMSLVGFEHVFSEAISVKVNESLTLKVASARVLALLKIVAFLDRPYERERDLRDLRGMLSEYEEQSERLFSDEIQAAELADFSLAPAFLLGVDLVSVCTTEEAAVVDAFLSTISDENDALRMVFARAGRRPADREEEAAGTQLAAFAQGLRRVV